MILNLLSKYDPAQYELTTRNSNIATPENHSNAQARRRPAGQGHQISQMQILRGLWMVYSSNTPGDMPSATPVTLLGPMRIGPPIDT